MIPVKLKNEMASDPFYEKCCITGVRNCKIEWHHNLIFQGRQVQEKECILPVSPEIHDKARAREMRERLDYVMLKRMSKEQIVKYSKAVNLAQRLKYLEEKLSP